MSSTERTWDENIEEAGSRSHLSVGVTGVLDTDVLDAGSAGSGDGGSVTEVPAKIDQAVGIQSAFK
jgi:hypothetical protein